jgi:hypothetical protein
MESVKNYQTLKQELKQLASELRNDKIAIKAHQKEYGAAGYQQCAIFKKKRTCRQKHIAYSMMRGRSYEQIEPKCREGNEPDMDLIRRIIDEYSPKDVCARQA